MILTGDLLYLGMYRIFFFNAVSQHSKDEEGENVKIKENDCQKRITEPETFMRIS